MASLANVLHGLQTKSKGWIVDCTNSWDKDNQWLDDVMSSAEALFKKPKTEEVRLSSATTVDGSDHEEADETGPILLPQTPRVKSARAARMQSRTSRKQSTTGRVSIVASKVNRRSSVAAGRILKGKKASMSVSFKANIGNTSTPVTGGSGSDVSAGTSAAAVVSEEEVLEDGDALANAAVASSENEDQRDSQEDENEKMKTEDEREAAEEVHAHQSEEEEKKKETEVRKSRNSKKLSIQTSKENLDLASAPTPVATDDAENNADTEEEEPEKNTKDRRQTRAKEAPPPPLPTIKVVDTSATFSQPSNSRRQTRTTKVSSVESAEAEPVNTIRGPIRPSRSVMPQRDSSADSVTSGTERSRRQTRTTTASEVVRDSSTDSVAAAERGRRQTRTTKASAVSEVSRDVSADTSNSSRRQTRTTKAAAAVEAEMEANSMPTTTAEAGRRQTRSARATMTLTTAAAVKTDAPEVTSSVQAAPVPAERHTTQTQQASTEDVADAIKQPVRAERKRDTNQENESPPKKVSKMLLPKTPENKKLKKTVSNKKIVEEAAPIRQTMIMSGSTYKPTLSGGASGSGSSSMVRHKSRVMLANTMKSPMVTGSGYISRTVGLTSSISTGSLNSGTSSATPSNLLNIRSFLPMKPVTVKPTQEELKLKKEEELRSKQEREELARKRKEELARAKAEEKRLQREARERRVLEARLAREEEKRAAMETQKRELDEKADARNKMKEAKMLEANALRAKKEAEERRQREEAEQRKREEERRAREEEEQRKRREEEEERKRRDQEQRRQEQKRRQLEEERRRRDEAEQERLKQRQRQLEEERRKREEEIEQLKQQQAAKAQKSDLNKTYDKASPPAHDTANMNSTFTKPKSTESYDMTPSRDEQPPQPLKNEDNYDICDLKSDEDTDDEDRPRKQVPQWAQGTLFRSLLLRQSFHPPDVDLIFSVMEASPDLSEIFEKKRQRFHKRTSSAVWESAPRTHKW